MNRFTIYANEYLRQNIQGFYHTNYTGYQSIGNPDYLNDLKNTFNNDSKEKLDNAINTLYIALQTDLDLFPRNLSICIIPRSKAEHTYTHNQLLFKKVAQELIGKLGFQDGSSFIRRHTNTRTTHLDRSGYGGDGDMPYPEITKDTCNISNDVKGKDILLIDDIYTDGVNIDEDAIQSLYDNGANSVIFYAVGRR